MSDLSSWASVALPSSEDSTTQDTLGNHASHPTAIDPITRDLVEPANSTSHVQLDGSSAAKPVVIIPDHSSIRKSHEFRAPASAVVFNVYRCWSHRYKGPYDRVYSIARLDDASGMETVEYIVTWPRIPYFKRGGILPDSPRFHLRVHRASLDGPLVASAMVDGYTVPQMWFGEDDIAVTSPGPHYVDGKRAEWKSQKDIDGRIHHCGYLVDHDQHETVYAEFRSINRDKKRPGKKGRKIAVWEFYGSVMDLDRLVVEHEVTRFHRNQYSWPDGKRPIVGVLIHDGTVDGSLRFAFPFHYAWPFDNVRHLILITIADDVQEFCLPVGRVSTMRVRFIQRHFWPIQH